MPPKKVLMLVSDLGFHWDELADAFHVFRDAGWQVDLSSPRGHPKAEAVSLKEGWLRHRLGRGTTRSRSPSTPFWGRPVVEAIMRAKRLNEIRGEDYDVIFVVGGYGDPLDLAQNPEVGELLGNARESDRWLGGRLDLLSPELLGEGRYEPESKARHEMLDPALLRQGSGPFKRVVEDQRTVFSSSPRKAGKVAARIVARVIGLPTDWYRPRVAEFLDRKSG